MRWILYIISYCSRLGRSSAILQKVELPVALYWCAWWCQPHGCPVTVQIADMAAKETLKEHYTNWSFNFTRDCPNDICLAGELPRTPSIDRSYSYTTKDITTIIINGSEQELHILGSFHGWMYISRYIAPVSLIGVGTSYMSITFIPRIKIVFVPPQQGQVYSFGHRN